MRNNFLKNFFLTVVTAVIFCYSASCGYASEKRQIVVNGDKVEFFSEQKKVVAEGNVVIVFQDSKLTCDKVMVFTETSEAVAEGHVKLFSPKGNLEGERLLYNFNKKTGTITGAKLQALALPFFGTGQTIEKFGEQHLGIRKGYLTTCDLEKPHYRMSSRRIDIYTGEKISMKDVRFILGTTTLFYLPSFTQVLNDKRPHVTVMPGYDKKWGPYLLQAWRYYLNENAKGLLHLDYRERKGFAWGIDYNYKILNMGKGLIRTYYTDETDIGSRDLWEEHKSKVKERFKAEWRHKWQVDDQTNLILQYYKLKDINFLQDYFKREYEKDEQPKSFFLLTRSFPGANLSFDVEKRVNHFFSAPTGSPERLPQVKFDLFNQRLGLSRFYFQSLTTYDTLATRTPQPAAIDPKGKQTERFDTYNQFSRQQKIGFIEARPYVAMRQTYFSRTNASNDDAIRGIFYSGVDLSTKFYRVFDIDTNFLNLDLHKVRHIITPTVSYSFIHQPTVDTSKLIPFDDIDLITRQNKLDIGIENKVQTKREGASVDLLRFLLSTDYLFKGYPGSNHFDHINTDFDFFPYPWLSFSGDSDYDTNTKKLLTANYDIAASGGDTWYFGFGQRYQRDTSNQLTGEVAYRLNPVWKMRVYQRFEQRTNTIKEQEYSIIRDLHCWEMELNFNTTRGEGNSIWIIFRLKAFPKMGFEFNNSFHRRKAGSQSETESQ